MTIRDRILCALGFHGPMEETADDIIRSSDKGLIGHVLRCTICKRRFWSVP